MKLHKPPFPELTDTGLYYSTQTGHQKTAIDLVVDSLKALPNDSEPLFVEMGEAMREWAIEAVIQGAWVRAYHQWEVDTKTYFAAMYARNGAVAPNWKRMTGSHVAKVENQLTLFSAKRPAALSAIDDARGRVNGMKHEDAYLATWADYECLVEAIDRFWQDLGEQEEFSPLAWKSLLR